MHLSVVDPEIGRGRPRNMISVCGGHLSTTRVRSTTGGYVFTRICLLTRGVPTLDWGGGVYLLLPLVGGTYPGRGAYPGWVYLPWTGYAMGGTPLAASCRRTFLLLTILHGRAGSFMLLSLFTRCKPEHTHACTRTHVYE